MTRTSYLVAVGIIALVFHGCAEEQTSGVVSLLGGDSDTTDDASLVNFDDTLIDDDSPTTGTKDAGEPSEPDFDSEEVSSEKDGATEDSSESEEIPCDGAGGFLCPCEDSTDCVSGFCVQGAEGSICSEPCVEECPDGFQCKLLAGSGPDVVYLCIPAFVNLCTPCDAHKDCQGLGESENRCVPFGAIEGSFCGSACVSDEDCPAEFSCASFDDSEPLQCVPNSGECACSNLAISLESSTSCYTESEFGTCAGTRVCTSEGLTSCDAATAEEEVCDGVDNDCDGTADEETSGGACTTTTDAGTCEGSFECSGGELVCDAPDATPEICDGIDNDCDGETDEGFPDTDEDGEKDCYDTDLDGDGDENEFDNCPSVNNPQQEDNDLDGEGDACDTDDDNDNIPDALDNCPTVANTDQIDTDGNSVGDACDGDADGDGDPNITDCAPADPTVFNGNDEICGDGVDNNCVEGIDEPNALGCVTYFRDEDEDEFGQGLDFVCLCAPEAPYTAEVGGDCADDNEQVNPGATEICDDLDNNCVGGIDEDCDDDDDGYCDANLAINVPLPSTCQNGGGDCVDTDETIHPDALEACDDVDNNCVDGIDEECDVDGDGFCSITSVVSVPAPSSCPLGGGDCDDGENTTFPGALDLPDPDFIDSNCDNLDGDEDLSVFVNGVAGSNNNSGTRQQPVKTINKGVELAQSQGKNAVLITGGVTYSESVSTSNGIGLYGAYTVGAKGGWNRSAGSISKIFSNSGTGSQIIGITANAINTPTRIQFLTIETANGQGNGGGTYGIYANQGDGLIVEYCTLNVGKGGNGSSGGSGVNGSNGGNGGNGKKGKSAGSSGGGAGTAGSSSCGANGGSAGSGGYATNGGTNGSAGGNNGGSGGPGAGGGDDCNDHGSNGGSGAGVGNGSNGAGGVGGGVQGGFWIADSGNSGASGLNGRGGGGGGGGAGGSSCADCHIECFNFNPFGTTCTCNSDRGGGGGGGGGGGCGGGGGGGGGGAGGSFGIFLLNADPTIRNCLITTDGGGVGGTGGNGGGGGSGGAGGNGGNGPDDAGDGGDGGDGSPGGSGGNGGGGAGGASYGIYQAGNSAALIDLPSIQFTIGDGGSGGFSQGNNGSQGGAGAVF